MFSPREFKQVDRRETASLGKRLSALPGGDSLLTLKISEMRREQWIYPALALITVAVFWPLGRCQFINYDDNMYVTENVHIQQGLTWAGVWWAFQATVTGNWHPVTCLSHMLDCQLFGLNAGAHHLVNLLFHVANTLVLFHLLRRMTREFWPSALVAALFAWHPLHVESVAWVAERKDMLSTFFGLLAIWAYGRYAQGGKHARRNYLLAMVFLTLGLMSKPMLVTWPFVFLLLDFWPLRRVPGFDVQSPVVRASGARRVTFRHLLFEKLPFLVLALAFSMITFLTQRHASAVISEGSFTNPERLCNVLVSYVRYLGKTIWPADLVIFYPYPAYPHPTWPVWQVVGSAALLASITLAVLWRARSRPFLAVGWLWFLGTLVPVIGLVQVGVQSLADRYSYIPLIGLFIMIVWTGKSLVGRWCHAQVGLAVAATVALSACLVVTRLQLRYWQTGETVWRHTLAVTEGNATAYLGMGYALLEAGKVDEGITELNKLFRIQPNFGESHYRIAVALYQQGRIREAMDQYRFALRCDPDSPIFLNNLAWLLAAADDPSLRNGAEAVQLAGRACDLTHYHGPYYIGTLAAAYAEAGRYEDAVKTAEQARALAITSGEKDLAERTLKLLEIYRSRHPYHERLKTN
jgi:Tfp pilus assembly protein PilF